MLMNKHYWNEEWKDIEFEITGDKPRYTVSNYGRLKSFQTDPENGSLLKGSVIQGYKALNIRFKDKKTWSRYVHKLVAESFVQKKDPSQTYVIHLDYNKQNNYAGNLQWASKEEVEAHQKKNPVERKKPDPKTTKSYKLTETKVKMIKRLLLRDKNRLKMIAKQFGITHTQLNRIRSGENWGHVTAD
jgi:hypothetical protein